MEHKPVCLFADGLETSLFDFFTPRSAVVYTLCIQSVVIQSISQKASFLGNFHSLTFYKLVYMYYCTSFVKLIHSSTVGWLFKVELFYHYMLPGCKFVLYCQPRAIVIQ
jgi:hypothetical protein